MKIEISSPSQDPGPEVRPLDVSVEVPEGIRDGRLEDIAGRTRVVQRTAAIRLQRPTEGLQMPQEILGFCPFTSQGCTHPGTVNSTTSDLEERSDGAGFISPRNAFSARNAASR